MSEMMCKTPAKENRIALSDREWQQFQKYLKAGIYKELHRQKLLSDAELGLLLDRICEAKERDG